MQRGDRGHSSSVMSGEPVATRPASPNPLERPLKIGWLKKQRSIVKNWQQRYFSTPCGQREPAQLPFPLREKA
uniref:Rho GTPase-activating protein 25 n=1 Tax=Accipiter nisus TaxID=211598 RepID=A0A8B9N3C8_9AVES